MNETFSYRAKPGTMALVGIFFGGCTAVLAHQCTTNDRGLIIDGFIRLGLAGATYFYGVLAGLSALFVVVAILATVHGQLKKPVLVLGPAHLEVPGGFVLRRRVQRIEFGDIVSASLQKVNGQEFLVLRTRDRKVSITRSLLSPDDAFDRIVAAVRAHLPRTTGGGWID